jgi:hypothetical protein
MSVSVGRRCQRCPVYIHPALLSSGYLISPLALILPCTGDRSNRGYSFCDLQKEEMSPAKHFQMLKEVGDKVRKREVLVTSETVREFGGRADI